jgi:biopolymer transport protein ExbD
MKIRRSKIEIMPPAVAMADIAFNLVLFFLMMARTQDESNLTWKPASAPRVQDLAHSRISVVVDENGKIYLNGTNMGVGQLAGAIQTMLSDQKAGERVVLLKIHKDTLAATFEKIIEAVSQAGGEVMHVLENDK